MYCATRPRAHRRVRCQDTFDERRNEDTSAFPAIRASRLSRVSRDWERQRGRATQQDLIRTTTIDLVVSSMKDASLYQQLRDALQQPTPTPVLVGTFGLPLVIAYLAQFPGNRPLRIGVWLIAASCCVWSALTVDLGPRKSTIALPGLGMEQRLCTPGLGSSAPVVAWSAR